MTSPQTQRKRLLALADQLRAGKGLTPEQTGYLAVCFEALGRGEDGNSVFGLSYGQGRSESDENRRTNLRLIFSWIAGAIDAEGGDSWKLNKAFGECAHLSDMTQQSLRANDLAGKEASLNPAWFHV